MNKTQKRRFFPSLRQLAFSRGIVVLLLIGSFLLVSHFVPECNAAFPTCVHTIIKTEQSGFNEAVLLEPVDAIATCSGGGSGSTGWTGSICGPVPAPTPTQPADCVSCPDDLDAVSAP